MARTNELSDDRTRCSRLQTTQPSLDVFYGDNLEVLRSNGGCER